MLPGKNILSSMQQKAQDQIFQSEQYSEYDECGQSDWDQDDDGNGGDAGCGPDDD